MPKIQINNTQLHYIELNPQGSEVILMVHGMMTNLSVFYFKIAPYLSKKYRVILYDLRSHGMSDWSASGYSLKAMSEDLIQLMDVLEINNAHLVGYSYGGLIALKTAIYYPERINKLVILESPCHSNKTDELIERYGQEYIDMYLERYTDSTNLSPNRRQIEKSRKLFEFILNDPVVRKETTDDHFFMEDEPLDQIPHNTLLLYGDASDCLEGATILERRIPNSILKIGKGDHNIPIQNSEWINEVLTEFLT